MLFFALYVESDGVMGAGNRMQRLYLSRCGSELYFDYNRYYAI